MTKSYTEDDKGQVVHHEVMADQADTKSQGSENEQVASLQPAEEERLGLVACLKKYRVATLMCVLASIGSLSDGYQVQMSGSIIALRGFQRTFGVLHSNGKYVLNPQHVSLWGSLKNVFAMLGAGIGSYPCDKIGRKWMILVVQLVMVAACILEQLATHWTHWLGARFLDGFSIGLAQCCINVYIGEMAPTGGRGALMSLMQLMYAIGSFLSAISLSVVNQQAPSKWRHAVLSQFALCGVAIISWWFLPESARWHLAKGREDKCRAVLLKVNGKVPGYDVDNEIKKLRIELENIKVSATIHGSGTYWDVFRGVNLRRLIVSILPWHWQVAIGVPIISTYSSYFFDMAGLANPFHGTVATNCVSIAMLIVAVPLIERLGRRTLLIWCAPISIASLVIMGGVLRTKGPEVGAVLIAVACLWQVGLNLSAGPMGYVYVAETATTRLRAKTTGIAIVVIQGMATVYVYITPQMLNAPAMGMSNTVFFFVGTGSLIYALVWWLVPETKGRTFAELDELFERKIPAWKFKDTYVGPGTGRRENEPTLNV